MKPRARRVTLAAAVLGVGVVAVLGALLAVLNWGIVRDRVEDWLQLTTDRETLTIEPNPDLKGSVVSVTAERLDLGRVIKVLADHSGLPVIIHRMDLAITSLDHLDLPIHLSSADPFRTRWGVTSNWALRTLTENGFRVLDQRFPRRAYVVLAGPDIPIRKQPASRSYFVWDPDLKISEGEMSVTYGGGGMTEP